eukprot:scaffold6679_cov144-Amphora_coffeaeformis.AAC.7
MHLSAGESKRDDACGQKKIKNAKRQDARVASQTNKRNKERNRRVLVSSLTHSTTAIGTT